MTLVAQPLLIHSRSSSSVGQHTQHQQTHTFLVLENGDAHFTSSKRLNFAYIMKYTITAVMLLAKVLPT